MDVDGTETYEAPAIQVLGPVEELTQTVGGSTTDS
jgi:hypothetical protein